MADAGAPPDISVHADPRDWPADVVALFDGAERDNVQFGGLWYRNLIDTVFEAEPEPEGDGGGGGGGGGCGGGGSSPTAIAARAVPAVRFHVLRRDGRAVAAVAVRVADAAPKRVESLANFYTCLFAPALAPGVSAADLVPLLRAVARAHAPMASLRLAPMDPAAPGYGLLMTALREAGLRPFGYFCFGNWFLPVEQRWADYIGSREGAVRSTIKRMGKKFAADAGRLEIITGGERLPAGLAAYEQVYAASWKNAEPFPRFMPGLIRLCADRGWLRLGIAWLGDRAIAAQVWIVANGRAEIYKLAYDEAFKAYSPGTLLTHLLMQRAFEEDRVREIDYLIGDDPYKRAWMSHRRERWGIVAYNPRTLAGCAGLWRERLWRQAKPWVARVRGRRTAGQPAPG